MSSRSYDSYNAPKQSTYTTAGGDGLIFNPYLSNVFDEIERIKTT